VKTEYFHNLRAWERSKNPVLSRLPEFFKTLHNIYACWHGVVTVKDLAGMTVAREQECARCRRTTFAGSRHVAAWYLLLHASLDKSVNVWIGEPDIHVR